MNIFQIIGCVAGGLLVIMCFFMEAVIFNRVSERSKKIIFRIFFPSYGYIMIYIVCYFLGITQ
jgi:hypothetical protein